MLESDDAYQMNNNISKDLKKKILSVKKFVKEESAELEPFDIKNYITDSKKLERYKEYQRDKSAYCIGLNDYQKAKEIVEFEAIENQQF